MITTTSGERRTSHEVPDDEWLIRRLALTTTRASASAEELILAADFTKPAVAVKRCPSFLYLTDYLLPPVVAILSGVEVAAVTREATAVAQVGAAARPWQYPRRTSVLGLVLVVEMVSLMAVLVPVLGVTGAVNGSGSSELLRVPLPWGWITLDESAAFVLVALLGGALGGALQAVASLTTHVAADDFAPRWTIWYLTNPFLGAAVAAILLSALQAGLGGQPEGAAASPRGVVGLAALCGLFSRHALDKLKQIFDAVVGAPASAVPDGSATAEQDGPPRLVGLEPSSMPLGSGDQVVVVFGTGFASGSVVEVADARLPARSVAGGMSVVVPGRLTDRPATLIIRVRSRGVWSNEAELEVTS